MKRFLLAAAFGLFVLAGSSWAQEGTLPPRQPMLNGQAEQMPPPMQLSELGFRDFESITTNIEPVERNRPMDYSGDIFQHSMPDAPRAVAITDFYWAAPELWYHPLYFDDVQLERYGQTPCPRLQPVLSGAHFFGSVALLPYKMGIDPPHGYVTNLGFYRPGSPTPCVGRRLPWERDAAVIETATVLGLVFILP